MSLPLKLTAVPDSTTIISGLPDVVKVSVRDKGSSLLRYDFGNEPTMAVDFLECADGSGNLKISSIEMLARVRKLFSNTTANDRKKNRILEIFEELRNNYNK